MIISSKLRDLGCVIMLVFLVLFLCCHYATDTEHAFANEESTSSAAAQGDNMVIISRDGQEIALPADRDILPSSPASGSGSILGQASSSNKKFYVTISDHDREITVKTSTATVQAIIEGAGIVLDPADVVEPARDMVVSGNLVIRIYRTRPIIIIDGATTRYVMSASVQLAQIVADAGLTLGADDQIVPEFNYNFMEKGVAKTYRILRAEQPQRVGDDSDSADISQADARIVDALEPVDDAQLASELEPAGLSQSAGGLESVGDPEPTNNQSAIIDSPTFTIPEGQETCAEWIRAAGVAESDLEPALELIYHESRCQVDATNPSSGAYGIPQALPATRLAEAGDDWATNPVTQIRWMASYVERRYGGWHEALAYWQCLGLCTSNLGTITKYNYWY